MSPFAHASLVMAFALFASGAIPAAHADPDDAASQVGACATDVAAAVQGRYESVTDLRASFEQSTKRMGFGSTAPASLAAKGEVHFQKPGRMHWAYREPAESAVISDGHSVWIYDPAAKEAQHFELGANFLSGAALQFLLGEGDLAKSFQLSAEDCDEDVVALALVPREPESYERITLRVTRESGELRETDVVDLLGNQTTLVLRDVRTGEVPPKRHFQFSPPDGVRVLRLPAVNQGDETNPH